MSAGVSAGVAERRPPARKHERIAAVLESEIRSGALPYGRQLPAESALAARFRVSRTTVRAALAVLETEGLVVTRPGKGSFATVDDGALDVRNGWALAIVDDGAEPSADVRIATVEDPALAERAGL